MNVSFFDDGVVDAMSKVVSASLPFLAVGMAVNMPLWYDVVVSLIGAVALGALIVRIVILSMNRRKPVSGGSINRVVSGLLSLPYALALSSVIMMAFGVDAGVGLWIAGLFALLSVAGEAARKGG